MKVLSRKAKGNMFEKWICRQIENYGFGEAVRTPGSGSGLIKSDVFSHLDWSIEAKNHKTIHILKWIDQAMREAKEGNADRDKWMLVFNDPRVSPEFTNVYAVLDFGKLLELLKKNKEPIIKSDDRELKYSVYRLKEACNSVLKKLKHN